MDIVNVSRRLGSLHYFHYAIIFCSLLLTVFASFYSNKQQQEKQSARFDREAARTVDLLVDRMERYADALASARAFYQNSDEPTYAQWKKYAQDLNLQDKYPGINGIGVVKVLSPDDLKSFVQEARIERPGYTVYPEHDRGISLPILYIEPEQLNIKAVGLDLAHEKNRFEAAMLAGTTGDPQITGPIVLVQDSGQTPGFLFYLPMYGKDKELTGYIDSAFIINNLMEGVLSKENRSVIIKIDSDGVELYNELLDSEPLYDPEPLFSKRLSLPIYGQSWDFTIQSDRGFRLSERSYQPLWILFVGIVIDLLITYLLVTMSGVSRKLKENSELITYKLNQKSEQLRVNEERLHLAFEATAEGLWDWDMSLNQVSYSRTLKELLGYREDEVGDSIDELGSRIHPDDAKRVNALVRVHVAKKTFFDVECRLKDQTGAYRWFRARGMALYNDDDRAVRMVGSLGDISIAKQAALDLSSAMKHLEKKNAELEQFTYIASHDLRSPLVNIMGFSEELAMGCRRVRDIVVSDQECSVEERATLHEILDRDIPSALGFIAEAVERMDMYSGSLLELSRLGRRELSKEPIRTHSLVEKLLQGSMHQIKERGIEIDLQTLPNIFADRMAVIQIFGNLIDNCIKYSQEGKINRISISGAFVGDKAVFEVSDTGVGIPESGIGKVFDVFQRGSHASIPGNGMGLTFVKALVEKQHGQIACSSIEGKGTTFTFSIGNAVIEKRSELVELC